MSRRNYRRRKTSQEDDETEEVDTKNEALEERRQIQKFRKRPSGVSAVGLALGKKLDPEYEAISDPFKLKTGGLVQMNDLIQDRERDREGEDSGKSINLGENFAAETNRRDEDTHMLKYIEEEIKKRKGHGDNNDDADSKPDKPKTKEDLLFQVPKNIDVRSRLMKSEEMLSNQMLSGIPEVDLGISAKIRNIEATEEAKMKSIVELRSKKSRGPTEMVPTNMASNFMLHSRFLDEQKSSEKERSKKAAALKAKKEAEIDIKQVPTVSASDLGVITDDTVQPGAVAVGVQGTGTKRRGDKDEKATDDFYYEKFRKRARDSWRYQ